MRSWHPLGKRRDFERLYREGTRFRSPLLTLVVRAEAQPGAWRAATVCSKKAGGAVVRNLLKRRLRNLLDEVTWPEQRSGDLALICKPEVAAAPFAEMARHVRRLLARAGLEEA
jgi:ribonuclease P protein component